MLGSGDSRDECGQAALCIKEKEQDDEERRKLSASSGLLGYLTTNAQTADGVCIIWTDRGQVDRIAELPHSSLIILICCSCKLSLHSGDGWPSSDAAGQACGGESLADFRH